MNAEQLRVFHDFEPMPASALAGVLARGHCLRVPAGRWLVRPGRALASRLYLQAGAVELCDAVGWRPVRAGEPRARQPLYPGCAAARTLSDCRLLSFDARAADWLVGADPADLPGVPEVATDETSWQARFLGSPLMQRLGPAAWQRVLRAMTAAAHDAGARVIAAGAPADGCHVLCKGRAEIRAPDGGPRLATLSPGDLFGEDALITGAVRNADVVMTAPGATLELAADRFEAWILRVVVEPLDSVAGRCLISLDRRPRAEWCVPVTEVRALAARLPLEGAYAVVGGTPRERYLAAFLLTRRGLDARPLLP
ncbi:MAG: cyclic nucleotide-binding domain-containing protein [Pseudomonadales bacterium]